MGKRLLIAGALLCSSLVAATPTVDQVLGYDEHPEWRLCEIKRYEHWVLSVSPGQPTLGTCVIKCVRPSVFQIWELTAEEFAELGIILRELELGMANDPAFKPDRFNTFQLCNVNPQLHFHVVPRYSQPREFAGQMWEDQGFGALPIWKGVSGGLQASTVLKIGTQIKNAMTTVGDCKEDCPCAAFVRAVHKRQHQQEQIAHMLQQVQDKGASDLQLGQSSEKTSLREFSKPNS
ncbi:MAG: hypothetical protein JSR80_06405 [Verrucomicrobia bacterium]|nr:hypothetical protein [Verrucomicrobiota bacterium]